MLKKFGLHSIDYGHDGNSHREMKSFFFFYVKVILAEMISMKSSRCRFVEEKPVQVATEVEHLA